MAPELLFVARCPWLSRTAGRPVYRPITVRFMAHRLQPLLVSLGCNATAMMAGMAQAREALEAFGKAVAVAMAPTVRTSEATER